LNPHQGEFRQVKKNLLTRKAGMGILLARKFKFYLKKAMAEKDRTPG
jgi:hypothetical protein